MEKEKKKRKVGIIITSVALVILLGISFTYAYFSSKKVSTENSVVAGTLIINYEDDNLNTVSLNNIVPIYDSEIKTKANKIGFKVNNTGSSKAYVDISLTDIVMDSELANLEFKWSLYLGDTKISNGNLRNVLDNKQLLINNIDIASNSNKSYQLYIWLSETDTDQRKLMGKNFSAKITVNGNQKKGKELLSKVIKDNNSPIVTTVPNFANTATTDEVLIQGVDKDGETYYFRGAVKDNYVQLGEPIETEYTNANNRCISPLNDFEWYDRATGEQNCKNVFWSYAGYESPEACVTDILCPGDKYFKYNNLWRIVRINGDGTIRLIANSTLDKIAFNSSTNSEEYVGYTYKTRIGYEMGEKASSEASWSINSSYGNYYADEVTVDSINGGYTLVNPVLHTGTECNNNKSLCEGKYIQFSSSTSKNNALYQLTTVESATSVKVYRYQYKGKAVFDENSADKDSTIKAYLDNWYKTNLANEEDTTKNFDKMFAYTRYCNDTTSQVDPKYGELYYGAYDRIYTNKTSTFMCPNTDKSYGGEYDLKIGLLSADEAWYAGGVYGSNNTSYYLHRGISYWLGSSYKFNGSNALGSRVADNGSFTNNDVSANGNAIVPVINLKSDILLTKDNGEKNKPYEVTLLTDGFE